jgi:hypothetical protein
MVAIRRRIALYYYLFCAVIALAPLPFGSVDETVVAFWAILLGVTTILVVPFRPSKPQMVLFLLASVVIFAWALIFHEQTSDHPWLAKDLVDPIWQQASDLLGIPLPQYVSVVRNQPFFAAGAQMVAFLSLLGGFLLGDDRAFARAILRTIAWTGALLCDLCDRELYLGSGHSVMAEQNCLCDGSDRHFHQPQHRRHLLWGLRHSVAAAVR